MIRGLTEICTPSEAETEMQSRLCVSKPVPSSQPLGEALEL